VPGPLWHATKFAAGLSINRGSTDWGILMQTIHELYKVEFSDGVKGALGIDERGSLLERQARPHGNRVSAALVINLRSSSAACPCWSSRPPVAWVYISPLLENDRVASQPKPGGRTSAQRTQSARIPASLMTLPILDTRNGLRRQTAPACCRSYRGRVLKLFP